MQNWLQLDIREKPIADEAGENGAPQPFNWLFDNNPLLKDIDQNELAPEQAQQKLIPVSTIKLAADHAGYLLEHNGEKIALNHGDILEYGDKHIHVHYLTPAKDRMPEVMLHPATLTSLQPSSVMLPEGHPLPGVTAEPMYRQALPSQQNNVLLPVSVTTPQEQVHDPLAFLDAGHSPIQGHTHHPMSFHQSSSQQHKESFVPTRTAFNAPVYHQPQPTNHPDLPRHAHKQNSLLADLPQPSPEAKALKDQFAPMHSVSPNLSVAQSPLEAIDDLFESQFDSAQQPMRNTQEIAKKPGLLNRLKQRFNSTL